MLPTPKNVKPITMGEGWTPLVKLEHLAKRLGLRKLYAKYEGMNPTGSFKDRGMSLAVTIARSIGVKSVVAASTGNTAASVAAYSARANLKPILVVPRGKIARGKMAQAIAYGAVIVEVEGGFDNALEVVVTLASMTRDLYPLNSFNPWRLEGQKTLAFEVWEQLGHEPDWVIVPVGNAGNISAIWKGFKELHKHGLIKIPPRMVGVQAEKAAPLYNTWRKALNKLEPIKNPETIATAIRIGKPVNWPKALQAVKESHGLFTAVSDNEILEALKTLARVEGLAVEPASATTLAALEKLVEENIIAKDDTVVLVLTGHGLKDPDTLASLNATTIGAKTTNEAIQSILRAINSRHKNQQEV